MTEEILIGGELLQKITECFRSYGPIREDGLSFLTEVKVDLGGIKAIIRTNENQHRGRPHCLLERNEKSASFDIKSGERLAGDLGHWNRTAEKVVLKFSNDLLCVWNDTRPDDQKCK